MLQKTLRAAAILLAGIAALAFTPIAAAHDPEPQIVVLHCGELLNRPGEPPRRGVSVIIEGDLVREIRDGYIDPSRVSDRALAIDLRDRFVMPGLIDCHTHITSQMSKGGRFVDAVTKSEADIAIMSTVYAKRTLDAGFTTIRNVGSGGDSAFALRDAIAAGHVPGPRILVAGESISPTGGHSDSTHGFREDLFAVPGAYQGIADGPDECRKAVRAQVKRGADVIKLTATGGVLSATDSGTGQQFFMDELEAIVETAHALGRRVAAHAHDADGINAALRAGVDSIEHGSFIDDESVRLLMETGAYLVPTLMAGETVATTAEDDPDYFIPSVRAKALAVGPKMLENFRLAVQADVNIAFGTDSGVSPHGDNAREFELMVEAGMTPMATLHSATVAAAELCGLSDEIGTIEPGKAADIIAYESSPLENISAVRDVVFVMKAGEAHRND